MGPPSARLRSLLHQLSPESAAKSAAEIPAVSTRSFFEALRNHKQCDFMADAANELGPIVQLTPKLVLCVDEGGIRQLTSMDKQSKLLHEKAFVPYAWYALQQDTMVALNGEPWSVRRRATKSLFSLPAIRKQQSKRMEQQVQQFIQLLEEAADSGETLDMQDEFCRYFFDFTGHFLFGFDVGCSGPLAQRKATGDRLYHLVAKGAYWCEMLQTQKNVVMDPGTEIGAQFAADRDEVIMLSEVLLNACRERIAVNPTEDSFIARLMSSKLLNPRTKKPFTNEDLRMDVIDMFVAGFDTSGHTATHFMQLVGAHPQELADLHAELESTRRASKSWGAEPFLPAFEDLGKMVHLDAVLKEVLRMRPGAPDATTRVLVEDIELLGHRVPKGSKVWANIYAAHYTTRNYDEPKTFLPGRWRKDGAKKCSVPTFRDCLSNFDVEGDTKAKRGRAGPWLPFGSGVRACLGYQLATFHLKKLLSTIYLRFDFEEQSEYNEEEDLSTFIMFEFHHGLGRKITRRRQDGL